jgi:signal transduction histidine kinase
MSEEVLPVEQQARDEVNEVWQPAEAASRGQEQQEEDLTASQQRTHEALEALLAIAEALVTVPPLTEVEPAHWTGVIHHAPTLAHHLLELICQVMGCSNATFVSRELDTDIAHLVASVGFTPEEEHLISRSVENTRFADRYIDAAFLARLHAGKVQMLDLATPPYRDQRPVPGLRQALVVPIRLGEVLIGVISLNHVDALHEYSAADLALAQGTARLAGLVLERERLLRERAEAQASALAALQANQRMDAFLGIAGHELKTPLTSIKGNLQIVKRRLAAIVQEVPFGEDSLRTRLEEVQLLLDRAERQVSVQNRLVSDLFDTSRIQAGQLHVQLDLRDLATIVSQVVEDQRMVATSRTIRLTLPASELVPVKIDVDRISQVIGNYLSNALKYAPPTHPIDVRLEVEGNQARLSVRDEGPGLAPAEQGRVWDRFYRVSGVERQAGTGPSLGLGLYICRMIIEQHGGQVGVTSREGQGSTFWFTLPLAEQSNIKK